MHTRSPSRAAVALALACALAPAGARGMGFGTPPPTITGISVSSPVVENATATITCAAQDAGSVTQLTVSVSAGTLLNGAATQDLAITPGASASGTAAWLAPPAGAAEVVCRAVNAAAIAASSSLTVTVQPAGTLPVVDAMTGPAGPALAGATVTLRASAHDPAGAALAYAWSATGGTISGSGATAEWKLPEVAGHHIASVEVSNAAGAVTGTVGVDVVLSLGESSLGPALRAPRRIAVASSGDLYVVDGRGNVVVLDAAGAPRSTWSLGDPVLSVAAAGGGAFVGTAGGRLLRVDAVSGASQAIPLADGAAAMPSGLAFDAASGLIWIAERAANQVRAVRPDGTTAVLLTAAGPTPLFAPVDVAVGGNGVVWVAQESNESGPAVHAFTTSGAWIRSALPFGTGAGKVARVGGVAVDGGGRLYASDIFQGLVQVLAADGTPLGTIGSYPTLNVPAGVAVARDGALLVASMNSGRIVRFGAVGAVLPPPAGCAGDSDCDGMPDAWEIAHGLNPFDPSDAAADPDQDGLTNLQEYQHGTDPRKADTDGDGVSDDVEVALGLDPTKADAPTLSTPPSRTSDPGLVELSATLQSPVACAVKWTKVEGPDVALLGAESLAPSFIARAAGTYRLQAVASCGPRGEVKTAPAQVAVTVRNAAPRPQPGRMVVVRPRQDLVLDGAASTDANGDALSFAWSQSLGAAATAGASGPELLLRLPHPGLYAFELQATDAGGARAAAEVPVLVVSAAGAPALVAGAPRAATVGVAVELEAALDGRHDDASFAWSQVEGRPVDLRARGTRASFVPPAPGRYAFQVSAAQGEEGRTSPPARVVVHAAPQGAALPIAIARVSAAAGAPAVMEPLRLDGGASAPAGGLTYAWRQVSGPAAGLTDVDRAVATVVPFEPGAYAFELVVTDASGAVGLPTRVAFSAASHGRTLPVARPAAPGVVRHHERVRLEGGASSGEGPLRYRWTQVGGPWVALDDATSGAPSFLPPADALYAFELEVEDAGVRSAAAAVTIWVFTGRTSDPADERGER